MATTIRELLVAMGVDADTAEVKAFDAALSTAKNTMLLAAAAATAVAGAVIGATIATARQGDEAAKAAARVGVGVVAFQELSFAAQLAGADMGALEVAFRRQAVSARDSLEGTGPAADAFRKIGVSAADANGKLKPQIELFSDIAGGLETLQTEADKMAVLNDLLGRGGARLLPLFNAGAEGIANMRREASALGGVLSEETIKAAEDFQDNLLSLQTVFGGLRAELGAAFLPVFNELAEGFIGWFKTNRSIIKQRLDLVFRRIEGAILKVRDAMRTADRFVRDRLLGWESLFVQTGKVIGGALGVTAFVGFLRFMRNVSIAAKLLRPLLLAAFPVAAPVILLAATLALLGLAIDDVIVFSKGGQSALGDFLAMFGAEEETRESFNAFLQSAREFSNALGGALLDLATSLGIVEAATAAWDAVIDVLGPKLEALSELGIVSLNKNLRDLAGGLDIFTAGLKDPLDLLLRMLDTLEALVRAGDEFAAQALGGLGLSGAAETVRAAGRAGRAGGGAATGLAAARTALARGGTAGQAARAGGAAVLAGAQTSIQVAGARVAATVTGTMADLEATLIRVNQATLNQAMAAAEGGNR